MKATSKLQTLSPLALALGVALSINSHQALAQATIYTPRGGSAGYSATPIPGTERGDRLDVGRDPVGDRATGYQTGLYGKNGERVGTLRTEPWNPGGVAVYDKMGRRIN